jgi:hypothetical protein
MVGSFRKLRFPVSACQRPSAPVSAIQEMVSDTISIALEVPKNTHDDRNGVRHYFLLNNYING